MLAHESALLSPLWRVAVAFRVVALMGGNHDGLYNEATSQPLR